jgi:solute carrier family 39 (zinc transporter), member 1/2/3
MSPEYAKILTMVSLGIGSFGFGLLPAAFKNYNLRRNPLFLTFLLCFGAGILMATSLVHILPEVSLKVIT